MRREASFPAGGNDGSDTRVRSGEIRTLTNEGAAPKKGLRAARSPPMRATSFVREHSFALKGAPWGISRKARAGVEIQRGGTNRHTRFRFVPHSLAPGARVL
jgi:hypothetical protein